MKRDARPPKDPNLSVLYLTTRPARRGHSVAWIVAKALDNIGGLARVADVEQLVSAFHVNPESVAKRGIALLFRRRQVQVVEFDSVASVRAALLAGNPYVRLIEHVVAGAPNRFEYGGRKGGHKCPLCLQSVSLYPAMYAGNIVVSAGENAPRCDDRLLALDEIGGNKGLREDYSGEPAGAGASNNLGNAARTHTDRDVGTSQV